MTGRHPAPNAQPANPETRFGETYFDRGARLILLLALVFILLDLAQLAYRFTLPTEGWFTNPDENDPGVYEIIVHANVVGAQSPLLPGDALQVIGGFPTQEFFNMPVLTAQPPAGWEPGGTVPVTVSRGGQTLSFDIPIVQWTLAAWLRSNFTRFQGVTEWLTTLIMLGVGLFTFFKRPGNLAGRFLFLFSLAIFAQAISGSLPDGLGIIFNYYASLGKVLFFNVIFAYLIGPSLLGFALTFPRPKAIIQRRPWLLVGPFLIGSSAPALLFIAPGLAVIGFPLTMGMLLAAVGALLHSALTMRDAISRLQMRWAVGGVMFGVALFLLNFFTYYTSGIVDEVLLAVAALGFPIISVSLAVAILRYRLFDIDVIIRRTLVYSALTLLLGLVYLGSITVFQALFSAISNQQSALSIVLSTLAIAALFNPLRQRVQEFVDRRFYRRKYNAEQALASFAALARQEVDLEQIGARLLGVVEETVQPESVSLWLRKQEERR